MDAPASRRTGSKFPIPTGASTRPRPGCRNSQAPGLGRESNRVVADVEVGRERLRRHLCARRHRRRPDALHGQGPSRLRIQHDDDRAVYRPLRRSPSPPASIRSSSTRRSPSRAGPPTSRSPSTARRRCASPSSGRSPARSRPAKRSTSAWISARRCRSTISTARLRLQRENRRGHRRPQIIGNAAKVPDDL